MNNKNLLLLVLTITIILILTTLFLFVKSFNLNKFNLDTQTKQAVDHGLKWMESQKNSIDTKYKITSYKFMYNVVSDPSTARRLEQDIKDTQEVLEMSPVSISDKNYSWDEMETFAIDLYSEQCGNIDNFEQIQKLKKLYENNRQAIDQRIDLSPGKTLSTLYFLKKLGIEDSEAETKNLNYINNTKIDNTKNLYAYTQIIFTKSDYYREYLKPREYLHEISEIRNALKNHIKGQYSWIDIDALSKLVISMKLLGKADNSLVQVAIKKIANSQNENGSWGVGFGSIFTTSAAIMALMNFPSELNQTNPFCLTVNSF